MAGQATTLQDVLHPDHNNFGLLRLGAAVSVVISHAFLLATGDTLAQPLAGLTRYNLGQHAVHVFFVLSGVMVAGSLDRSASVFSFALARALRIIPGLAVCALLTALVLGPVVSSLPLMSYFGTADTYVYPMRVITLVKVSVPLPGVFEANPLPAVVNDSLWTLKYEAFCYAILMGIAIAGVWRSRRAFLVVLVLSLLVCVPVSLREIDPSGFTIGDSAARFWLCFLLGLALYRFRARVLLLWPVLAGTAILWWFGLGTRLEPVLTFVLTGYGAVVLAAVPLGTLRGWAKRHDLSYGVYIYGWPTSQALVWGLPGISPAGLALLSVLVAGILGWLSWSWIERPSLRARYVLSRWLPSRFEGALRST